MSKKIYNKIAFKLYSGGGFKANIKKSLLLSPSDIKAIKNIIWNVEGAPAMKKKRQNYWKVSKAKKLGKLVEKNCEKLGESSSKKKLKNLLKKFLFAFWGENEFLWYPVKIKLNVLNWRNWRLKGKVYGSRAFPDQLEHIYADSQRNVFRECQMNIFISWKALEILVDEGKSSKFEVLH